MPFETNFTPDAHAELARQIEGLAPSAQVLTSRGFSWLLASYLERLIRGDVVPDLSDLRAQGLDVKTAVSICEAISARRARIVVATPAPKAVVPVPKQPEPPVAPADALDAMSAMSMLHTLFEMAGSGHAACLTLLMKDGWSEQTSREFVRIINAARPQNRGIHRG